LNICERVPKLTIVAKSCHFGPKYLEVGAAFELFFLAFRFGHLGFFFLEGSAAIQPAGDKGIFHNPRLALECIYMAINVKEECRSRKRGGRRRGVFTLNKTKEAELNGPDLPNRMAMT
jgi:hypothetical protein